MMLAWTIYTLVYIRTYPNLYHDRLKPFKAIIGPRLARARLVARARLSLIMAMEKICSEIDA